MERGSVGVIRHHALRLVNVAVLAALMALLYRAVDLGELRVAIRHADLTLLAVAFALNVPTAVLFAVRSHFVLARLGHRVEARVLIPAMILGNVAGSLTPASTGEILRAAALRTHANIPASDSLALVFFERGLSLYLLALSTGIAAACVSLAFGQVLVVVVASLPLFAAPAFAPLVLRAIPAASERGRGSFAARSLGHLHDATARLRWILEDRRLLAGWSLATFVIFTMSALQVWLLSRAVSDVTNPTQGWVAFGASQLAGIGSLVPFGLGAMDGSLAAIFHRFGLTLEQGAATAVLLRLIITIPYGVTAIVCHIYLQRLGVIRQRSGKREQA